MTVLTLLIAVIMENVSIFSQPAIRPVSVFVMLAGLEKIVPNVSKCINCIDLNSDQSPGIV